MKHIISLARTLARERVYINLYLDESNNGDDDVRDATVANATRCHRRRIRRGTEQRDDVSQTRRRWSKRSKHGRWHIWCGDKSLVDTL